MARPRRLAVDPLVGGFYHCHSRCVRRLDLVAGPGRRDLLVARIESLAAVFAIDVCEYAVMDNHLHLILRTHPELAWAWSVEEVAARWLLLRGRLRDAAGRVREAAVARLAADGPRTDELRRRLADLGWFHKELKEPCSRRWNRDDGVTGHFWQGRYGAALAGSDVALVSQAVYVLLNRVRCGAERSLGETSATSLGRRIARLAEEIREGRHADALAGFGDRFADARWTPVFPCDPGGARDLDDAEFARRVAEGRQRHAVRAAFAEEGRVRVHLAADAPAEELEPHVLPGGSPADGSGERRPARIPRHRLRRRPSTGVAPSPRRCAAAWLTAIVNPFHRSRTGAAGAVEIVAGLPLSLLVALADADGRQERPDKPCRIDPSEPPAMDALLRRAVDGAVPATIPASPPAPAARRIAEAVEALLGRQREVLRRLVEACSPAGRGGLRVPWRLLLRGDAPGGDGRPPP